MGSISHHITPLVINSLGGGHTHTHTHAQAYRHSRTEAILRNQVLTGLWPARAWFKKYTTVYTYSTIYVWLTLGEICHVCTDMCIWSHFNTYFMLWYIHTMHAHTRTHAYTHILCLCMCMCIQHTRIRVHTQHTHSYTHTNTHNNNNKIMHKTFKNELVNCLTMQYS